MADEKYAVGDVLYVISSKTNQVIPVQVVEEVRTRTMEGEKVTYVVQIGPHGEKPLTQVDKLPRPIFRTIEAIKQHMVKNATAAIDMMVKRSTASAAKWYSKTKKTQQIQDPDISVDSVLDDVVSVDVDEQPIDSDDGTPKVRLEDGTIARVKISQPKL